MSPKTKTKLTMDSLSNDFKILTECIISFGNVIAYDMEKEQDMIIFKKILIYMDVVNVCPRCHGKEMGFLSPVENENIECPCCKYHYIRKESLFGCANLKKTLKKKIKLELGLKTLDTYYYDCTGKIQYFNDFIRKNILHIDLNRILMSLIDHVYDVMIEYLIDSKFQSDKDFDNTLQAINHDNESLKKYITNTITEMSIVEGKLDNAIQSIDDNKISFNEQITCISTNISNIEEELNHTYQAINNNSHSFIEQITNISTKLSNVEGELNNTIQLVNSDNAHSLQMVQSIYDENKVLKEKLAHLEEQSMCVHNGTLFREQFDNMIHETMILVAQIATLSILMMSIVIVVWHFWIVCNTINVEPAMMYLAMM